MASEVASAYVTLTANTGGLTTGLTAAEAKVRGFASSADRTASRASKSFSAMGVAMKRGLMVGGIAAGVALGSAVKTAADFETEMSALRSVTKAGAKDMDRLKESALDLGAATKFSALEVAGAQTELARAGMSTSQILGGSLKGSLALAAAGQMELADASATIVDTMGQFGLKVGDATHIADALAEAANATTADVGEMAQALENVGNIARNAGLSFDQTVVGLELLAENGTKGAEAGSALRSMLTNISKASPKAAKTMKELGLEFYDAQGNFKDFGEVSSMLRRSFSGLTAEQKQHAAATIAGTYGQKALLAIMSGGPKLAAEFADGLRQQGAAAEMAAVMNDNLEGKLEQLGGAVETIKIRVGSALIPILSDAAVATAEWLDTLGDSEGLKDFAGDLASGFKSFASAAGEAWTVVQPLLSQLGGIGVDAFHLLQGAVEGAAPVLMTAASAIGAVASAALSVVSPVTSAAAALAGIPAVSGSATAALLGVATAFAAFKTINMGLGVTQSIAGFTALVSTLRGVRTAATTAAATQQVLRAQTIATATAGVRADAIAAASRATYLSTFTKRSAAAARVNADFAKSQIRTAAIAATSARTFGSTFAPAVSKAAAPASRLGAVMGALAQRFPATAAGLSALASPAGIAAAAIGGTTAAVLALSSGMFAGPSTAERMASGLRNVANAARDASNAISGMKSATLNLKEANVAEEAALIRRRAAYKAVRDMTRGLSGEQLKAVKASDAYKAAVNAAAQADIDVARAHAATTTAKRKTSAATLQAVGAQLKAIQTGDRSKQGLASEIKAYNNLVRTMGLTGNEGKQLTATYAKQVKAGESVAKKFNTIRATARTAAVEMRKAGDPKAAAQLEKIGSLDDSGLQAFASKLAELEAKGVKGPQAVAKALKGIKPPKSIDLKAKDNASPKIRKVKGQLPIPMPPPTLIGINDQASGPISSIKGQIASIDRDVLVTVRVQGEWPHDSPRVYEIPELMKDPGFKSRTFTVTARPQGTGQLESMARTARAISSGDLAGLKGRFGGGSTSPLKSAISNAGSLLIKANLDIANLPEVLQEASQAGLTIGGAFGKSIDKQRQALARTVGQSNELIKRIEALRNLTGQLGRAQAAVKQAKGGSGEMKKARAQLAKVQADIAKAQKRYQALAGNDSAAEALGKFNKRIARQVAALNKPARDLRDKAEEFNAAKERFVEAFKTTALEQFDRDTQARLDSIRGTFEDGFRQIGGAFELVPGIMSQVENRLTASTRAVTDALQAETDAINETYRVRGKALDRELSREMKAFDKQAQARQKSIDDATKREQDAIDARYKALTASEAKLAALRGQQSDANLNRNVMDAEAALREAITKKMPTAEVQTRMRAVEDARNAVQIDALEKRAEVERAAADAQAEREKEAAAARGEARKEALEAQIEQERYALEDAQELRSMALQAQQTAEVNAAQARAEAQTTALQNAAAAERIYWQQQQDAQTSALESQRNIERASLERSLENWGGSFMRLRAMVGGNHATILGQVNHFADGLSMSGQRLGASYADGLRKAFPHLRRAAEDAAGIIAKYLQLHSPADKGPLSSLDKWWKPLGPTLIGGSDIDAINRALMGLAHPANGGASGPAAWANPVSVEVHVHDRTTVGMSRDQARRLASEIKPELDRIVGIR